MRLAAFGQRKESKWKKATKRGTKPVDLDNGHLDGEGGVKATCNCNEMHAFDGLNICKPFAQEPKCRDSKTNKTDRKRKCSVIWLRRKLIALIRCRHCWLVESREGATWPVKASLLKCWSMRSTEGEKRRDDHEWSNDCVASTQRRVSSPAHWHDHNKKY